MLIKMFAIAVICASAAATGFWFAYREGFRAEDLNTLKQALLVLRSEITFTASPLSVAAENVAERLGNSFAAKLFETLSQTLMSGDYADVNACWEHAVAQNKPRGFLNDEDYTNLHAFGRTLGYLDREMQLNSIDMTVGYIDQALSGLAETLPKNRKLYRSLGVLGGILVAVALF